MPTDLDIKQGAEALADSLTMLGINPNERPEHGGETTAEVLARIVLNSRWQWLKTTITLQNEFFSGVPSSDNPQRLAEYMRLNFVSAIKELSEAMDEVGWKTWTTDIGWYNKQAFIEECVDANHFIANMLGTVGCTDEEYELAYQQKQEVNRQRMASGTYNSHSSKCPGCKRDLNGPGVECKFVGANRTMVHCADDHKVYGVSE